MVLLQSGVVHVLGLLDLAVAYSSPPVAVDTVALRDVDGATATCASDGQLFVRMPGCEIVRKQFANLPAGAGSAARAAARAALTADDDDATSSVATAPASATAEHGEGVQRAALLFRPNVCDERNVERCCASPVVGGKGGKGGGKVGGKRGKSKRGKTLFGRSPRAVDLNAVFARKSAHEASGDAGDRYQREHSLLMERLREREAGGASGGGVGGEMLGALSELRNKMGRHTEMAKEIAEASAALAASTGKFAEDAKAKAPKQKRGLFGRKKK